MKNLQSKQLEEIRGGGCMKWIRRYNRAVSNGMDNEEYMRSLMWGFEACIEAKYN